MSDNNPFEGITALIKKYHARANEKILQMLLDKYKVNTGDAQKVLQTIHNTVISTMIEKYHWKEPFVTDAERNKPPGTNLLATYPDFRDWIMLSLSVPYYESLGDTIGYKNGQWEFNYGEQNQKPDFVNDLLYEFIALGGINDLSLVNWVSSDDTILYMATMQVLTSKPKTIEEFGQKLRAAYLMSKPLIKNRHPGQRTMDSLDEMENIAWDKLNYNSKAIGNGSAMRSGCIGIFFPGKHNRKKLIALAVESSRITHNSATAIMGSVTSALFTAYALEKVPLNHWPHKLMGLFKSGKIDNYMKKSRPNEYHRFREDKVIYIAQWEKYLQIRFSGLKPRRDIKFMTNPVARFKYLSENFSKGCRDPGGCADDCLIMAYDSLLECDGVIEKILVYSILHPGDSDTVGSVAFSWFGAFYGSPKNEQIIGERFKELEFIDELHDLLVANSRRMIKVYYYDIYLNFARKYMKSLLKK